MLIKYDHEVLVNVFMGQDIHLISSLTLCLKKTINMSN